VLRRMKDVLFSSSIRIGVPFPEAVSRYQSFCRKPNPITGDPTTGPEEVARGVFRLRKVLGMRTWIEDTVTMEPSGVSTDVIFERRWHAPVVGQVLSPAWKLTWRMGFAREMRNFERFLGNGERHVA